MTDYSAIKCKECGSNMAPILYGYPTPEMIELAKDDVIALGGCIVNQYSPTHYCYECNETN